MNNYILLILGMTLVTYIPRLVPVLFLTNKEMSPKVKRFLQYIPYTSLSVLIVRGVLTASPDMMLPTIAGIGAAGVVAYTRSNLVLSVAAGIITAYIMINIL